MTLWNPERSVIASARAYRRYMDRRGPLAKVLRKLTRLRHGFWSATTGSTIIPGVRLGERLRLPHPIGVVIHKDAVIGDDCMIMQQVTIGQLAEPGAATLGRGVYVGAGARILGDVAIGDHARIGANAVVLTDVPAYHTTVGVPAELRSRSSPDEIERFRSEPVEAGDQRIRR